LLGIVDEILDEWSANRKLSGFHGGISPLKSASRKWFALGIGSRRITGKPEVIRWSLGISNTYRAPDCAEVAEERDAGLNMLVDRRANILVRLQRSHNSAIICGLAWGVAP